MGLALGKAGQTMELTPAVEAAHRKYFAGRDKVLMLIDILEGEELFFVYEQGYLQKREGYYIYYEKNLAMQEYMIYKREEEMRLAKLRYSELAAEDAGEETERLSEEEHGQTDPLFAETKEHASQVFGEENGQTELFAEDDGEQDAESSIHTEQWQDARPIPKEPKTQAEEALESYRKMLLERQGKREERQNRKFLYTASSFFLVVLCVIGITTINNYWKMQKVEDVLNVISDGKGQPSSSSGTGALEEKKDAASEEPLVVETVESQVEPLDSNGGEQDSSAKSDTGAKSADEESENDSDKSSTGSGQASTENSVNGESQNDTDKPSTGSEQASAENSVDGESQNDSSEPSDGQGQDASVNPTDGAKQEEAQETSAGQQRYYTVQAGDTLNSICLNIYKTKDMVKVLKEVNGIEDGDKILVGQKLLLP